MHTPELTDPCRLLSIVAYCGTPSLAWHFPESRRGHHVTGKCALALRALSEIPFGFARSSCLEGTMAFTCCSPDAREQLRVSRAIDLELVQWKRDAQPEFKVLLAGTYNTDPLIVSGNKGGV